MLRILISHVYTHSVGRSDYRGRIGRKSGWINVMFWALNIKDALS